MKNATKAPSTRCLYLTTSIRQSATIIHAKSVRDSWKLVAGVRPAAIQRKAMVAVWKVKPAMMIACAIPSSLSLRMDRYVEYTMVARRYTAYLKIYRRCYMEKNLAHFCVILRKRVLGGTLLSLFYFYSQIGKGIPFAKPCP